MAEPVVNLGARLRDVRLRSGLSLREVSRQLGVSPSFVSQLENGKSQPSVGTLYSMAQLLDVSIDELFATESAEDGASSEARGLRSVPAGQVPTQDTGVGVNRSDFSSPVDAFPRDGGASRVSVTRPGERVRLEMDTGVVWEQLATNTGANLDFMEIVYPPRSSSTNDQRMLQHAGAEFGYLLEGELEITVGFDVFTLHAGEALGFDSSQPHIFRNLKDTPARGIWYVQHPA
ncbi:MAG TPA: XRE family transcriptional regulator [Candidatus Nanopelagicales bacterium]|nr:XRE family transcriptional regulator [Candidatus Nanopelagicales bacterium]